VGGEPSVGRRGKACGCRQAVGRAGQGAGARRRRTIACRRRRTASARPSLPLPAAPEAWRSANSGEGTLVTPIDKVREWLESQGFPLEMRVAAAFREVGFQVRQSSHYLDSETGKAREIDVLATDPDDFMLGIVEIHFVIECKATRKPWVLLSSPDTLARYNRLFAFGVLTDGALDTFVKRLHESIDLLPWLRKDGLIGYSLRQALHERSDIAYSAAMSVAKACEYLVRPPNAQHVAPFVIAFPVIVVDAPLIECSLQADGQLRLNEVDQGEFLFSAWLPRYFGSCIRVITAKYLPVFTREAKQAAEQVRAVLKPEEEKVRESWHQR
jgi:hypothetical protein